MIDVELQKPDNTGKIEVERDENGRIKPGTSLNPNGRPKGAENFKTKWLRFIEKIADKNNLTVDDVDEQLLAVAFKKMKEADFRYWKDVQDRVYGMPKSNDNTNVAVQINIGQILDELENE